MFLHIILAKLWVAREINEPHSERVRGEEPGLLTGDIVGGGGDEEEGKLSFLVVSCRNNNLLTAIVYKNYLHLFFLHISFN